jgi:hypothetical protein
MIWSKAFIQGESVSTAPTFCTCCARSGRRSISRADCARRLLAVLLSHLILFGFVYPDKRRNVPPWVMDELTRQLSVSRPTFQNAVLRHAVIARGNAARHRSVEMLDARQ